MLVRISYRHAGIGN